MILDEIVEDKKKRLPGHMARIPETEMRRMAATFRIPCAHIAILRTYICLYCSLAHLYFQFPIILNVFDESEFPQDFVN